MKGDKLWFRTKDKEYTRKIVISNTTIYPYGHGDEEGMVQISMYNSLFWKLETYYREAMEEKLKGMPFKFSGWYEFTLTEEITYGDLEALVLMLEDLCHDKLTENEDVIKASLLKLFEVKK